MSSAFQAHGIGIALMKHIIDFARRELAPVDLLLTSRPNQVTANEMYGSWGLKRESRLFKKESEE